MHILMVTHYFEPDSGAAATRLSSLARHLQSQGHTVTVLTTLPHYPQGRIADGYRNKLWVTENRDGIHVIRTWLWTTAGRAIGKRLLSQLSFALTATIRGFGLLRVDVVFVEYQPIFTGLVGRWLADRQGVPYVLNISDLWPDHLLSVGALTEKHPIYRVARSVVDAGYRGAGHIVTLSPAWAEKIAAYAPQSAERITTILRGTDTARLSPQSDAAVAAFQRAHELSPQKKWVSFLGTFATQYDFASLLDVAAHFKGRDDMGFIFIGAGTQQAYVAERIERDNLHNVRLIPWVQHTDMPVAWSASTITYWAMRDESLYQGTIPAKLYEALACGVPVVAGQRGVAAEILREAEAGIVVAPDNANALMQALETLLADSDLRIQYSQNGRAYALAHFDKTKVAEQYAEILAATVKGG